VTSDAGDRFEERDVPSIEFDTAPARVSDRGADDTPSTSGPAAQAEDDADAGPGFDAAESEPAAQSAVAPEDAAEPPVDAEPEIAPLAGINQALSAAAPEADSGLATAQTHGKGQLTAQAPARMAAQARSATAATPPAAAPAGPDGGGIRVSVTPASLVAPSNAALGGGAAVAALAAAQAQANRAGNTAQSAPAQGAGTAPSAVQVLPAGLAAASQPVQSGSGLGNPDTATADQTSQPRNAQTPNAPANNTQAQNTLAVAGGISEIRVTNTPGQVARADTGLTNSGQANTVQANTGQTPAAQADPAGPANAPVPPAGVATEEPATGAAPGTQGPTTPRNSALAQLATTTGRPNEVPGGPSGDSPTLPEPKGQLDTSRSQTNPALNAQGQAAQGQAAQGQAGPAQAAQLQQSGATGRTPVAGKAGQGAERAAPAAAGNGAAASGQPAAAQPGLIPLGLTQAAARIPGMAPVQARPTTPGAVPVDQVAVQIQKAVGAGQDRIRIQLHPAELGRIDVKLDLGNDGFVKAVVSVDKPETFELFQRDLRGLERALQDAGLKTDSGSLSFNLRGEDRGAPGSGQERGQPNDGTSRMDLDEEAAVEPAVAAAVSATDGRIDIRV
jgi:flagellar hook-length control protein FliK